jgi:phosphate starvation-inducible PhoH-like protein|tara:strand:- start:7196 stop:7798 length:603 start_codon:yes stop_codon:yes gene_type:complete
MNFPKTPGQCEYLRVIQSPKPIVIATGPAGSGKTMFGCQVAAEKLANKECKRLILTRPIVAADEDMGYLPGEMERKMEPWIRPMMDVFENYLTRNQLEKHVCVEPLGFMRGRTFNDSFIIADEMQNSTPNQMKMLLTRLGDNSKLIVMGDLKQSDLGPRNGLADVVKRIKGLDLEYIEHVIMDDEDILRHPAVAEILKLY